MARSLNKAALIGNLTRDPELRYTPQGTAVCTLGLATNRQWTTDSGEKKEEAEFHRIVAWNKLAELCAQLLSKGRKVYVEGRLQTRTWTGKDDVQRTTTEIVISDMIILDAKRAAAEPVDKFDIPEKDIEDEDTKMKSPTKAKSSKKPTTKKETIKKSPSKKKSSKDDDEDMPF
ncbi:MAG: single-stranded DNA-binding protein [Patescibacteria group bacterium]